MLLTKYADYSIKVLMFLARRPGHKVPITEIADAYGISRNHLMKVSQNLARHGYIIGYRGKGGGIVLARHARSISLGEVLEKVEVNLRPSTGPIGLSDDRCDASFREALDTARRTFIKTLTAYTLADIVFGSPNSEELRLNGTNGNPGES